MTDLITKARQVSEQATPGPWDLVTLQNHNRLSRDFGQDYLAIVDRARETYIVDDDSSDENLRHIALHDPTTMKLFHDLWEAAAELVKSATVGPYGTEVRDDLLFDTETALTALNAHMARRLT